MKTLLLVAKIFAGLSTLVTHLVLNGQILTDDTKQKDFIEIKRSVVRTGTAFNERIPDTILAFYSKDILVSFPGVPDSKYEDFVKAFEQLKNPNPNVTRFTRDSIEEIFISGNLAFVRVNWITTTLQKEPAKVSTAIARDLQIWRKENEKWKFYRGMWFREPVH